MVHLLRKVSKERQQTMTRRALPLNYPGIHEVKIHDPFWDKTLDKIVSITLPDVWDKYEKDGTEKNFLNISEGWNSKEFYGTPWQDGMIYEIIRGASDLITDRKSERVEALIDKYIEKVTAAQDAIGDGYIQTFTTIKMPNKRFGQNGGFLIMQHDLYNAGCLFEAGVHHYEATGKTSLLRVAVRMANYICSEIGYPPKKNIVSAHPMVEQATVKLYRLMKREPELAKELGANAEDYLELGKFWIDYRGVHENRASFPKYMREYAQDHQPLRKQHEAVGHAVRAALVYTGMIAVANEIGDEEMYDSSLKLWENVTETKMHVTGGIGAVTHEERFGYQYELPSNAYLETCAAIAMALWAGEMHRGFGQGSMFDVFERALYNNVLASLSECGTKYTYVNPLVSDGKVERWDWHQCPCCPPMLMKMMGAVKSHIYSFTDTELFLNLYIGSELETKDLAVTLADNVLTFRRAPKGAYALHLRIPEYVSDFAVAVNGKAAAYTEVNGYAVLEGPFADGDAVAVTFKTLPYREEPHPYAQDNIYGFTPLRGSVVRKGPFLYCAEEIDNGDVNFTIAAEPDLREEADGSITGLKTDGERFRLIPYYLWNNRGNGTMRVWLNQEGGDYGDADLTGWEHKLYRAKQ